MKHNSCVSFWRPLVTILFPIALLPLVIIFQTSTEIKCGYVMALMVLYWVTELIPLPVTGFIPVILFPLLGIQSARDVARNYFQDSVLLFVGNLLIAVAVEETNLHERIAVRVLLLVGAKPIWTMTGFMIICPLIAMSIGNVAATSMLLPTAVAAAKELTKYNMTRTASSSTVLSWVQADPNPRQSMGDIFSLKEPTNTTDPRSRPSIVNAAESRKKSLMEQPDVFTFGDLPQLQQDICKVLVLCIPYSSSIGGTATLTATMSNTVFRGQLELLFKDSHDVTYASYFFFAFPTMAVCLLFAWSWLSLKYFVFPYFRDRKSGSATTSSSEEEFRKLLQKKCRKLGPLRFSEASVLAIFAVLVALWFFRDPGFIPGWGSFFKPKFLSDTAPAMLFGFLLFIWPKKLPAKWTFKGPEVDKYVPILTWATATKKFPWNIVFLLGGTLALADGVQISGLTTKISDQLAPLASLSPLGMVAVILLIVCIVTELVASNAAVVSIFLPIVAKLAQTTHVNPLYLMLPVTIGGSFSFLFPSSTPPNAIAFGTGFFKTSDFVKTGFMLNICCYGVLLLSLNTLGIRIFHLNDWPAWADPDHLTMVTNVTTKTSFINRSLHGNLPFYFSNDTLIS